MQHKFFRLIPDNPNIPFTKFSGAFMFFSIALTVLCFVVIVGKGLNYGIDFRGGTEVYARFQEAQTVDTIRDTLEPIGYKDAVVQSYGDATKNEFLIRVQSEDVGLKKHETYFDDVLSKLNDPEKKARIRFSEDRFYVSLNRTVELDQIQQALAKLPDSNLQIENIARFGRASNFEYKVQFSGAGSRIVAGLKEKMGAANVEVLQIEEVGQKVGSELRQQALGAVLISLVLILVYIWFRFDFEFAPGAILALAHDVAIILGVFAFFQFPFDLSSIAAVLTIVGYSINDTIVTYDRIRENIKKAKASTSFSDIVNLSINEMLARTLLLSGTVLMATVILYFFGGPITKYFALALTIGVVCGTYSSICVASPFTIYMRRYIQNRTAKKK